MIEINIDVSSQADKLKREINGNISKALNAAGLSCVGHIVNQMQTGYHVPHGADGHTAIRQTGQLQRDVNYQARAEDKSVMVGNSLSYATYVHEGTSKLGGRPYIKDGIEKNIEDIKTAFFDNLTEGIE